MFHSNFLLIYLHAGVSNDDTQNYADGVLVVLILNRKKNIQKLFVVFFVCIFLKQIDSPEIWQIIFVSFANTHSFTLVDKLMFWKFAIIIIYLFIYYCITIFSHSGAIVKCTRLSCSSYRLRLRIRYFSFVWLVLTHKFSFYRSIGT